MAFKRSAVRSRLSPPTENAGHKSGVFLFGKQDVHPLTSCIMIIGRVAAFPALAPERSAVRSRLSPPTENAGHKSGVFLFGKQDVHPLTSCIMIIGRVAAFPALAPERSAVRSGLSPQKETITEEVKNSLRFVLNQIGGRFSFCSSAILLCVPADGVK